MSKDRPYLGFHWVEDEQFEGWLVMRRHHLRWSRFRSLKGRHYSARADCGICARPETCQFICLILTYEHSGRPVATPPSLSRTCGRTYWTSHWYSLADDLALDLLSLVGHLDIYVTPGEGEQLVERAISRCCHYCWGIYTDCQLCGMFNIDQKEIGDLLQDSKLHLCRSWWRVADSLVAKGKAG